MQWPEGIEGISEHEPCSATPKHGPFRVQMPSAQWPDPSGIEGILSHGQPGMMPSDVSSQSTTGGDGGELSPSTGSA